MCAGSAKPHGTENTGHEGDVVVHQLAFRDFAHLAQLLHHVQPEDIGLAFLQRGGVFFQRLADGAVAVQYILDAQPMRHFVKHGVAKERVKGDVLALILGDQLIRNGYQDLVELGQHGVFQLQAAGTLAQLHLFVVGQIDGDGLGSGIRVSGHEDHVVGIEIGVGARHFFLVLGIDRQAALQVGHELGKTRQALAPGHVLQQHEGLKGRAIAVEAVLVGLNRADDQLDGVVFHVHPGHVGGLVVIGQQRRGAQIQVTGELRIFRQAGSLPQQRRNLVNLFAKGLAVGDQL